MNKKEYSQPYWEVAEKNVRMQGGDMGTWEFVSVVTVKRDIFFFLVQSSLDSPKGREEERERMKVPKIRG